MSILILEDKLGITDGYLHEWTSICFHAGLMMRSMTRASIWKTPGIDTTRLLIQKGNRKSPGFNPDPSVQMGLRQWVEKCISVSSADSIVCQDVALLGLIEPRWDIATIDYLRGGVYDFAGLPFMVTVPISAINTKKKPKDIKAMNDGFDSKDDWEEQMDEQDDKDIWMEPYSIPYGKWVLQKDMQKFARIIS